MATVYYFLHGGIWKLIDNMDYGHTRRVSEISGPLTVCEFDVIKTHTQKGCEMINEAILMLSVAAVIANDHHERLDGTGYHGLAGYDIHFCARLAAVADVFDALISNAFIRNRGTKTRRLVI